MNVSGKNVLLTGASRGIGKALAIELGSRGARLAICSRDERGLEATSNEVTAAGGPQPMVIVADLSDPGEARAVAGQATNALGQIDALINNAGMHIEGFQWDLADGEVARAMWEANYWSPISLSSAVIPLMLKRRSGMIVNVTSVAQATLWPGTGHYASSKAASSVATETMRMELRSSGVRVLHVVPGPIKTRMYDQAHAGVPGISKMTSLSPLGDPAVLARKIVIAMQKDKQRVVYPIMNNVPLHFPRSAQMFIARLAKRAQSSRDGASVDLSRS